MAEYNPNSTPTKGVEWAPALAPGVTLDSGTKVAAMSVLQTVAGQVIANEKVYVGAIPTRQGCYALEVYDNETGVPDITSLATVQIQPNEDVAIGNWTGTPVNSAGNRYQNIDELVLDTSDYISHLSSALLSAYDGRMNGAGLVLTGKRVLAVRWNMAGSCIVGNGAATVAAYTPAGGGANLAFPAFNPLFTTVPTLYTGPWATYNDQTRKPWTIADIAALDAATAYWEIIPVFGAGETEIRVHQVFLDILTITENRLAVGNLNDAASALTQNAWNTAAVLKPDGTAWTKDGAGRHLYTLRRLSATGALVVPGLSNGATPPNPASGFAPTVDPSYGYISAMGAAIPQVFGLVQRTNAPADSVDSQPYTLQVEAKVYSGQSAQQEFSNAAATLYQEIVAMVKPNGAAGDLSIKVKTRAGDVQVGQTITWTAAEVGLLPDAGNGWKVLDRQMSAGGLLAIGTQYYIEFSDATAADDGTGTKYWSILTLDVGDATTGVTAGFGGTTDRGTINGAEADRYDIATKLASIPVPPAGFTATVKEQTL